MSPIQLQQPGHNNDWKSHLAEATRQSHVAKLLDCIYALEESLTQRLQQLGNSAEDQAERYEIEDATRVLLKLKTEKLGWKDALS